MRHKSTKTIFASGSCLNSGNYLNRICVLPYYVCMLLTLLHTHIDILLYRIWYYKRIKLHCSTINYLFFCILDSKLLTLTKCALNFKINCNLAPTANEHYQIDSVKNEINKWKASIVIFQTNVTCKLRFSNCQFDNAISYWSPIAIEFKV